MWKMCKHTYPVYQSSTQELGMIICFKKSWRRQLSFYLSLVTGTDFPNKTTSNHYFEKSFKKLTFAFVSTRDLEYYDNVSKCATNSTYHKIIISAILVYFHIKLTLVYFVYFHIKLTLPGRDDWKQEYSYQISLDELYD